MNKNEALQEVDALSKGITHDAAQLLKLLGTGAVQLPIGDSGQYVVAGTLAAIASVIGSAVSTAVGEPVATDDVLDQLYKRVSEAREAAYTFGEYSKEAVEIALSGVLDMIDEVARLAAPTQVSAPQANELSISRQKLNMAKIDVLMDGARARSEEFRDGVTFGANSLHMKMLELAGAPQASAAQEVRAMPVGYARQSELDKLADGRVAGVGMMIHKEPGDGKVALYLEPTSTSTAPAAMDEMRSDWAKWIAQRGRGLPDHACAECAPHSDMLVAGFQCVYHQALATSQPSLDEVTGAGKGDKT